MSGRPDSLERALVPHVLAEKPVCRKEKSPKSLFPDGGERAHPIVKVRLDGFQSVPKEANEEVPGSFSSEKSKVVVIIVFIKLIAVFGIDP